MTTWTEESPTKGCDGFNWYGQHSSKETVHNFRWVYSDGTPATDWVDCEDCEWES
jgi:hypothetical protein